MIEKTDEVRDYVYETITHFLQSCHLENKTCFVQVYRQWKSTVNVICKTQVLRTDPLIKAFKDKNNRVAFCCNNPCFPCHT